MGDQRQPRTRPSLRRRVYAGLAFMAACLLIASAIADLREPVELPAYCADEPDAEGCEEPAPAWAKLLAAGGLLLVGGAWVTQELLRDEDDTPPPFPFLDALMPWSGFVGGMGRWARMLPRHGSEHPDEKHPRHGDHWPPR